MPLLSLTNRLHTVPFHPTLRASFPLLFVLIWSSGFIIARYGMPHA